MTRRTIAAAMAVLAVLLLAPDRVGSVPATTSTTNLFGLPASTPPSPLTLYPRRPGARYEDAEARPNQPVQLALNRLRLLTWKIEPHDALPGVAVPAKAAHYRALGLVDGYSPSETSTDGDLLHVVIRVKPYPLPAAPTCVATGAIDGAVLMPYDQPPPKPARTTTTADTPAPFQVELYFPIGARRGRIYVACLNSFFDALIGDDTHAVWGIDVDPPAPRRVLSIWALIVTASVLVFFGGCLAAVSRFHLDFGPTETTLPDPPPPAQYATAREVSTRGDKANPGALFHGAFPSDPETQEREVGGLPARFSGYTTWVRSIARVQANHFVDAYPGEYLRVRVTVFNRDKETQHVCACDFFVWTRTAGFREADAVAAPALAHDITMTSGARRGGYVYLYVGTVPGPYYIVYNPDKHVPSSSSSARGVWRVPA